MVGIEGDSGLAFDPVSTVNKDVGHECVHVRRLGSEDKRRSKYPVEEDCACISLVSSLVLICD